MSADLLRRAAAKLRQHVEKASPGPWTTDSWEIFSEAEAPHWLGETLSVDDEPLSEANAAYIALMHPPVALAVAELLEVLATEQQTSNPFDLISAESLARAILREPS
jgi:hypothetical protein